VRIEAYSSSSSFGSASSSGVGDKMDLSGIEGLEKEDTADEETAGDAPVTQKQLQQLLAAMHSQRRGNGSSSSSGSKGAYVSRGLPTHKGLSEQQVKASMDAGKCFACGSTGHRRLECPKRVVDADGEVSWGK
jgi:hypothetical protein